MRKFVRRVAIPLNLAKDAEVLVKGFISPFEYTQYGYHVEWDELINLQVAEPEKRYPVSVFQAFPPSELVAVGECRQIQEEGVLTLLRQLCPRPQLKLHINSEVSRGLWACLRAYNNEFAEIIFRIHGQFVMKSGWLTPSQFAGHLVIDRFQGKVVFFKMHVPETTLNFDIGWTQDGRTTADSGKSLRAGVLSDDQIIAFLNENFINTWVPNAELGRTVSLRYPIMRRREREGKTFDTTHALAQAIMKGWKQGSPVD